jgi:ATP-binding cassette, subfamily C, bacterial CydD
MRALDPRLLERAGAVRRLLAVDVAVGVAAALLVLAQAVLLARIVSEAFHGAAPTALRTDVLLLALAFAGRGTLTWSFEYAGRRTAQSVLSELRAELVERRLRGQPRSADRAEEGEIVAAAVQGVDGLEAYFARYLPQLVLACSVPVAVVAFVASIDLRSALLMLLTLPLVPVFMWLIGRYTEERTHERWLALQLLSSQFLDVVRGLPTLRAFNQARSETARLDEVGERYRRATMGTLRIAFLSGSVLELAATLGVALVAVTVGVRMVGGGLGLEAGLTVLVLAPELYLPLRRLGAEYHASVDGLAVAERILGLLEEPPVVREVGTLTAPDPAVEIVRFEGVSFGYAGRVEPVLDGFELELLPGETVALVGASGAGKSTVADLLLRLVEPGNGRITVGGVDLAACRAESWREHLAWVPQRPAIVRGTVADNIRLADADASDERVREAAELAAADGFVRKLPAGYRTQIGDGARQLSAGERRRIALARAFLRPASLVVLDEPTADLDDEKAEAVASAIDRLRRGRTMLLIAHRPELVRHADRVVRLEAGRAVEPAEKVAA